MCARFIGQRAVAGEIPEPPNGCSAKAAKINVLLEFSPLHEFERILNPFDKKSMLFVRLDSEFERLANNVAAMGL